MEQVVSVFAKSEPKHVMNTHEFVNFELNFDLNNPYESTHEIIGMLDEIGDVVDNEPIEEVDNVQIGDVVVDKVGVKDAQNAWVVLKQSS